MIRIVFFTILLLGLVFLLGDLLLRVIGWKRTIGAAVAWGVAVLLTALQFVAYPLFLLHASFSLFCVLFSVVLAALVFFSLYRLVKDKERVYAGQLRSLGRELRAHPVSAAMVLFITAAYFYRVFFYHYPDSDDAYYLARAMEAVAQNALHLDHTFIWTGLPSDALGGVTDASTFEYLKAYFSVLSGIHVSIICRTGLLLVLNLAHFGAILTAADSLDPNGHSRTPTRCLFFALYLIIQMACHLLPCSGVWMTNYLWQGKALLPGLVFPLLLAACAELFERRDCFRNIEWLSALVALTAGAAASIVGIILGPVFYVVMGLSFVIAARFRNFGKIVVCAALAALPILICAVLSYIDVATNTTRYLTDLGSLGVADWWGEYSVTAEKPQMFLLALSFLYLLLRGSKLQKVMLILPSAILLISFANPLLIHPVSSYLTTPLVYWRLFWVMPLIFSPAFAGAMFTREVAGEKMEQALLCSLASLGLFFLLLRPYGGTIPLERCFSHTNKTMRSNLYELQDSTLVIADTILDDWQGAARPVLLAEEFCAMEIRQYTVDIALAGAVRDEQKASFHERIPGTQVEAGDVYVHFQQYGAEPEKLHELLAGAGVDYVVFDLYNDWELSEGGFTQLWRGTGYTLWKV